ncbi:Store-operated calcium entry-associated regulatory factor [Daldinia childiae]|uniref:Store-operated calcium entry-associated regulatory factor n=1 Tax=Daldinia childiae TaxID=326645 RepID=UPI00144878C3|nr:Store-operated calcium entry-associated regulatory factor [Daldinia childiae]KAF3065304.1 Store-operated calcium entry-associated regulatory factor [Daldinia childiae]
MHLTPSLLLLLWTSLSPHPAAAAAAKPQNAILLSDVQSLTLRGGGAQTKHRRVSAVPQLRCVSPAATCRLHEIDVMRCANQGSGYDAQDIQWSCTASLPPELKLGSTDVVCEGYSSPDDPYVLKGSCGVEYRLLLTESGEAKFPDIAKTGGTDEKKTMSEKIGAALFGVVFALVCMIMIYSACVNARNAPNAPRRPRDNRWGGGGGGGGGFDPGFGPGGGGDDWNDPPPPYPGPKYSSTAGNQSWRPGFWTGAATGAAAGYVAGSRGSGQDRRSSSYESRAGPSSSSQSTSSARYEGTGFGSTSRR